MTRWPITEFHMKKKEEIFWITWIVGFISTFDADINLAALKIDTFEKIRQNVDKNLKMNFSWRPSCTQSTNGRIDALRQQQRNWAHHMFAYCVLTLSNHSHRAAGCPYDGHALCARQNRLKIILFILDRNHNAYVRLHVQDDWIIIRSRKIEKNALALRAS